MHVDATPDAVKEMERMMRINEDILRYLTLSLDEIETGPSVLMTSRASHPSTYRSHEGEGDTERADVVAETVEALVVVETVNEGEI
jgi:small subunit ribosomal protein S6